MPPWEASTVSTMPRTQPVEDRGGVDDYALAAGLIAVILIIIIIAVVIWSYCQTHTCAQFCRCALCPCQAGTPRRRDIVMGYLPANIAVNSAALEQGVPDIFLRGSEVGRFSLEPYSSDFSGSKDRDRSRDRDPPSETSGAWSEYFRRAIRKGTGGGGGGGMVDLEERSSPEVRDLGSTASGSWGSARSPADRQLDGEDGVCVVSDNARLVDDVRDKASRDDVTDRAVLGGVVVNGAGGAVGGDH